MSNDVSDDEFKWPASHAILVTVAGSLSLIGSYIIIREVGQDMKERRGQAISRMLMTVSIADVIWSLGWAISTYAMPSTVNFAWGNVGTSQTCNFQGFLVGLGGASSPCFSAMLSMFYLLLIRYTWTDQQLRKLEPYIYICVWTLAFVFAIVPIPTHYYNPSKKGGVCYLAPYPLGCVNHEEMDCIRGEKTKLIMTVFTVYAWLCILIVIVNMIRIYATVRTMEDRNARYATNISTPRFATKPLSKSAAISNANVVDDNNFRRNGNNHNETNEESSKPEAFLDDTAGQQSSVEGRGMSCSLATKQRLIADRKKSRSVAVQGIYYGVAFLSIYVPHTVEHILGAITGNFNLNFNLFCRFCLSLQGVWNCFIFIRNRKMKTREGKLFRRVLCFLNAKQFIVDAGTTLSRNQSGAPQPISSNNPSISTGIQ